LSYQPEVIEPEPATGLVLEGKGAEYLGTTTAEANAEPHV